MTEEYAIKVENISKSFKIYHENRDSVYESILGIFSRKKYYETLNVLNNISFQVNKGEMFGIIGKNGTGKTTILRIISNIFKPDSGSVQVNGKLVPLLSLGIGFQQDLTARENIMQYGIILGLKKDVLKKKINKILQFAELEKFTDTKIKKFSSGMYIRLAFATAMQVDPDIIIIDEALAAGDLSFQKKALAAVLSFKERGKTIISVSHDVNVIKQFCDRAMLLNDSKIVAIGNPEEVVDKYMEILNPKKS